MSEFFAMGGYAAFVWPAYALVAALLGGLWIASVRSLHAREAELEKVEPSERRRASR